MTGRTLILRISFIVVYCVIFILISLTLIEVADVLEATIYDLQKNSNILLACALIAALVPTAAMLFWIGKATATDFYVPVIRVCQYLRTLAQR
jgi:hypothetical protein